MKAGRASGAASPPVPGSAVAPVRRTVTQPFRPPWLLPSGLENGGTGWGNRNPGARSPFVTHSSLSKRLACLPLCKKHDAPCSCQSAASGLAPAALCAAGVRVRAAVAAEQRDSRGVSDLHFAAPASPRARPRGGRSRPRRVSLSSGERRAARDIGECAESVGSVPASFPSVRQTPLTGFAGDCVHIGERAPALNQRLRRSPPSTPASLPARAFRSSRRFSCSATWWPTDAAITTRIVRRSSAQSSHSASLRPLTRLRA